CSAANVQLPVDLRQIPLDRLRAGEKDIRDLSIRSALRHELGYAPLRRRQLLGYDGSSRDSGKLLSSTRGPLVRTNLHEQCVSALERRARGAVLTRAAFCASERQQRSRLEERALEAVDTS